VAPYQHREQDDQANGVLRLHQDAQDGQHGRRFAPAVYQRHEGREYQQRAHSVDLTPQGGVVPRHRHEQIEGGGHEACSAAEPRCRSAVEEDGNRPVGGDRRKLQHQQRRL
jgi:hypothetical protein